MSSYYIPEDLTGYGAGPEMGIPEQPPLHQVQQAPFDIMMGLRRALLQRLGMGGGEFDEMPGMPGVQHMPHPQQQGQRTAQPQQHQPGRTAQQKTPNATAKALKAAGSIFSELAKHHEAGETNHPARPQQQERTAHPQHHGAQPRRAQPAHHPVVRPHPLVPYQGPLTREGLLGAVGRLF